MGRVVVEFHVVVLAVSSSNFKLSCWSCRRRISRGRVGRVVVEIDLVLLLDTIRHNLLKR